MANFFPACALALFSAAISFAPAQARPALSKGELDALVARHVAANGVPEALVRRVIRRESSGNPRLVSHGNYGLMQIKLQTARSMGYQGSAAGLLDAETNMTYAVKYLAGAYQVAHGNQDLAVHYYAAGYYYAAKRQGRAAIASDLSGNVIATAANDQARHEASFISR
jgi:soluble lytic murein transglycosylase-like protein